jgi:hypothetical protein
MYYSPLPSDKMRTPVALPVGLLAPASATLSIRDVPLLRELKIADGRTLEN